MNGKRGFTERLAGFSARHAWLMLGIWVLLLVGAFLLAGNMDITAEEGVSTTDAARARDLVLEDRGEPLLEEFVLVEADEGPIDEQLFESVVGSIVAEMRALPIVTSAVSYLDGATSLRTPDGRYALIQVTPNSPWMTTLRTATRYWR